MLIKASFNTGRLYAKDGQRIIADFNTETLIVRFIDFSRGIDGKYQICNRSGITSPWTLQENVMFHYDTNDYRGFDDWQERDEMRRNHGAQGERHVQSPS